MNVHYLAGHNNIYTNFHWTVICSSKDDFFYRKRTCIYTVLFSWEKREEVTPCVSVPGCLGIVMEMSTHITKGNNRCFFIIKPCIRSINVYTFTREKTHSNFINSNTNDRMADIRIQCLQTFLNYSLFSKKSNCTEIKHMQTIMNFCTYKKYC